MILVKKGASIANCRQPILVALIQIASIFESEGVDTVVTSGSEVYKHTANRSAHYRGDAIDVRSRTVADPVVTRQAIADLLGADFVVILESNHFHIHWSPVYGQG